MKKIVLSLLAASVSLMASAGCHLVWNGVTFVEVCPKVSLGSFSELATLETFKNDIIDHSNQVEFANKGEGSAAIGGALGLGNDVKWLDIVPRYNPTGNIGLDARLPMVQNSDSDEFGIGDISLSGNYHFGNLDSEFGTNITTLRYKASTGEETDGLGTGEGAISLTHTLAKNLGDGLRFHGLAQYTMNMGDIDDAIALMGGVSHTELVPDMAVLNAKFTYFQMDKLSVADLWIESSSTTIVPGVPLSAGLKIPLINDYDGADPDKYFMLYATMHSFFDEL